MILQPYIFKGIPLTSAIKVYSYKLIPKTNNVSDIELTLNRYTSQDCQFDIEQFTMMFYDISNEFATLENATNLETMIVDKLEWAAASII